MAAEHRDVVLVHMKVFGLRLNAKKSVLSPLQRTTYLGVVWDSTTMPCSDRVDPHGSQKSERRPVTQSSSLRDCWV